jgi:hypothetical protein
VAHEELGDVDLLPPDGARERQIGRREWRDRVGEEAPGGAHPLARRELGRLDAQDLLGLVVDEHQVALGVGDDDALVQMVQDARQGQLVEVVRLGHGHHRPDGARHEAGPLVDPGRIQAQRAAAPDHPALDVDARGRPFRQQEAVAGAVAPWAGPVRQAADVAGLRRPVVRVQEVAERGGQEGLLAPRGQAAELGVDGDDPPFVVGEDGGDRRRGECRTEEPGGTERPHFELGLHVLCPPRPTRVTNAPSRPLLVYTTRAGPHPSWAPEGTRRRL